MVLGNKNDLESERQCTVREAEAKCKEFGVQYLECSAKDNINVTYPISSKALSHIDQF